VCSGGLFIDCVTKLFGWNLDLFTVFSEGLFIGFFNKIVWVGEGVIYSV
jgi:hypothetical protein